MKKLYIKPQFEVVSVGVCQMICESLVKSNQTTEAAGVTEADARERGVVETELPYGEQATDNYGDLWQ